MNSDQIQYLYRTYIIFFCAEYPTSLLFNFPQCIPSAVVSFAIARNKINVVSISFFLAITLFFFFSSCG